MVCRNRMSKAWWASWPLLIGWVAVVTANHYWVDAALGWLVALAAVARRPARSPAPGPTHGPGSGRGPREAEA